jgi:hypothetical protein
MAPPQKQGVIERFTNDGGEDWLGRLGRRGRLTYTGGIAAGRAEGCGTLRCRGGQGEAWAPFTIRDAEFRGGRMLPCRAVCSYDATGDAFAGPLAAAGRPADGARGAYVRGADGGRFQGEWHAAAAAGADRGIACCFLPRRGAAWAGGRVYAVELDGTWAGGAIASACGSGWGPGEHAGWRLVGVLLRPTAKEVPQPPTPPTPNPPQPTHPTPPHPATPNPPTPPTPIYPPTAPNPLPSDRGRPCGPRGRGALRAAARRADDSGGAAAAAAAGRGGAAAVRGGGRVVGGGGVRGGVRVRGRVPFRGPAARALPAPRRAPRPRRRRPAVAGGVQRRRVARRGPGAGGAGGGGY